MENEMYFHVPACAILIRLLAHACAWENITNAAMKFCLYCARLSWKVKCIFKYLLVLSWLEC